MKKLIYSILFLAVSLSTLQSCSNDDDNNNDGSNNFNNQVSIGGDIFDLNAIGSLESYGEQSTGAFDWDVTLVSTADENIEVYFDLNTNSATGLVAGTYMYSTVRDEFTFVDTEINAANNINYSPQQGTVIISTNGDNTSITFNLVAQDDTVITGQWTGTFVISDESDN